MHKVYAASAIVALIVLASSPRARTQSTPANKAASQAAGGAGSKNDRQVPASGPVLLDGWGRPVTDALKPGEKPGPAPRHDISGIWEPARGPGDGIQAFGPRDMPYDGAPAHNPPYSSVGLDAQHAHKPLEGEERVLESLSNDPRNRCDPLGFPRADFYQIRHTQIMQDERKVDIL